MVQKQIMIFILLGVVYFWPRPIMGHARFWEPPGRSTMWRRGYKTPINYQDNELYCGGFQHQMSQGYKCGVCGDPYDGRRDNEAGGMYAKGIVTRTYRQGQQVTFQVDVTANHKGYFEFKICPTNNPKVKETQACFDRHTLTLADGSGSKYFIPSHSAMMSVNLKLPPYLSCDFCVVQWRYHAGNNWGTDPNGRSCVGCGPQEEFYGCADIRILPAAAAQPIIQQDTFLRLEELTPATAGNTDTRKREQTITTSSYIEDVHNSTDGKHLANSFSTDRPSVHSSNSENIHTVENIRPQEQGLENIENTSPNSNTNSNFISSNGVSMICQGIVGRKDLDQWCQINCQAGFCPSSHCSCVNGQDGLPGPKFEGCKGTGKFIAVPGIDQWCRINCAAGDCPSSVCVC